MPSPKKIYGLIGYPVKHSLSPAMHNAAFKFHKIDDEYEYRLFEVKPDKLKSFLNGEAVIDGISSGDVQGFNVTIPHKVEMLNKGTLIKDITTRLNNSVALAGAVNTVKREQDKLLYRNTDSEGFLKSLREDLKFDTQGKEVLIVGCGGAGRAVIAGLMLEGTGIKKIYTYDKSEEALKSAKKHFSSQILKDMVKNRLEFISEKEISEIIKDCQLLVNASPIGMEKDDNRTIIAKNLLHKGLSIYDVVYNRKTQLIKDAQSLGLPAKGGLGMLLYQGVLAWNFWMQEKGLKAPVEEMRKALEQELAKR